MAILHPLESSRPGASKSSNHLGFKKLIRGKKIEINYQQRQLGIFEFHWVTSEIFHYSSLSTSHLIKWIKRYMSNASEQDLVYCKVNGLKTAVLSQRITNTLSWFIVGKVQKKTTEKFFPNVFEMFCLLHRISKFLVHAHDKAITELFQSEIWWLL